MQSKLREDYVNIHLFFYSKKCRGQVYYTRCQVFYEHRFYKCIPNFDSFLIYDYRFVSFVLMFSAAFFLLKEKIISWIVTFIPSLQLKMILNIIWVNTMMMIITTDIRPLHCTYNERQFEEHCANI